MKNRAPTLREFLDGATIEYAGFKRTRRMRCTYQMGVGVVVESAKGDDHGLAEVVTDQAARRLYWNLTRRPQT